MKKHRNSMVLVAAGTAFVWGMTGPAEASNRDGFAPRQMRFDNERFALRQARRDERAAASSTRLNSPTIPTVEPQRVWRQVNVENPRNNFRRFEQSLGLVPANLDLRSNRQNFVNSQLSGTVSIVSGSENLLVTKDTRLTPAEAVAVYQVLYEGGQTIDIGNRGSAVGGTVALTGKLAESVGSINVPSNVTVVDSDAGSLSFAGRLINAGNFYSTTSDPGSSAASISAASVRNRVGGTISTVLPGNLSGGGAPELDLHLHTAGDFSNSGAIASSGNLNVTAGGSIINALEKNEDGSTPSMTANGLVSLDSDTIINRGTVSSANGDINLATHAISSPRSIVINSVGGRYSALNGNVVIGNNKLSELDSITLDGGDFYSKSIDIDAGASMVNGNLGIVTGELKTSAGGAHIGASTDNLLIGSTNILGDPTFFNAAGDVTIGANLTYAAAIAILASGDVTDGGNAFKIEVVDGTNQALVIVAGAELTAAGGATGNSVAQDGNQIGVGTVTVTGVASSTGGSVDLSQTSVSTKQKLGGAGGIKLIAFKGGTLGTGTVNVKSAGVDGTGFSTSGDIVVIAGADQGDAVVIGSIDTDNNAFGGNTSITVAQPTGTVSFDVTGKSTGVFTASTTLTTGDVRLDDVKAGLGDLTIRTAGDAFLGDKGGTTNLTSFQHLDPGGAVDVQAATITVNGPVLSLGHKGIDGFDGEEADPGLGEKGFSAGDGGSGSRGGDITLVSTVGDVIINADITSMGGQGGTGGKPVIPEAGLGQSGGNGGGGGFGGGGGIITINSAADVEASTASISSTGGLAGLALAGANGANADPLDGVSNGGNGGPGGGAGGGGDGGNISITAVGTVNALEVSSLGTDGGLSEKGGKGGNGVIGNNGSGGAGGDSFFSKFTRNGGDGGAVTIKGATLNLRDVWSKGGSGGPGGLGGDGNLLVAGKKGGAGGAGGDGGPGGNAGTITLEATVAINGDDGAVLSVGGAGADGAQGGVGGTAGNSKADKGGNGGAGGGGGAAGQIIVSAPQVNGTNDWLVASSAGGGGAGATGGKGGQSNILAGGLGGNGGAGGATGKSSKVTITGNNINLLGSVTAANPSQAGAGGTGGAGGVSLASIGGVGGLGGNGGASFAGGDVTVTAQNLLTLAKVLADAGTAGAGGAGGAGSNAGGATSKGGAAGDGGNGGAGAKGGLITLTAQSITMDSFSADGSDGSSGGEGGAGGDSGTTSGDSGGAGDGGDAGITGGGGTVKLTTTATNGNIVLTGASSADAGQVGGAGGAGGNAGNSSSASAGKAIAGGAGGAASKSAIGGTVTIKSLNEFTALNGISVLGSSFNLGQGGNGGRGNDTKTATGGAGGKAGVTSAAGKGGTITITTGNKLEAGGLNASGGEFGSAGGAGGQGGNSDSGAGGAGGAASAGSASGAGGKIALTSSNGNIVLQTTSASGGATGGLGGGGGTGGTSQTGPGGKGGVAGAGGSAGAGGTLTLTAKLGTVDSDFTSVDAGALGGSGGAGGAGGASNSGPGGAGGVGGKGGAVGKAGTFTVTANTIIVNNASALSGIAGGTGGKGGAGGGSATALGGAGGLGGLGGSVNKAGTIKFASATSVTSTSTLNASAGAGGAGGDGGSGGDGATDGAGGKGGDGGDGGDGGSISTIVIPAGARTAAGGAAGSGGTGAPPSGNGTAGTAGSNGKVSP